MNDYLLDRVDAADLPVLPCKKCKEVEENYPEIIEKCLKIQKFSNQPTEKKKCRRSNLSNSKDKTRKFYRHKEYHFYNSNLC